MELAILGIGPVCALGSGVEAFHKGLSGERLPQIETVPVGGGSNSKIHFYKAMVEGLERFVSSRSLRRLDSFTQMALLSSYLAIDDAEIEIKDKNRIGMVFGYGNGPIRTTFNFLDCIIEDGDENASPTLFATSVHNASVSQISIIMQFKGPCSTVTSFNQTLANVLLMSQYWLEEGITDYVLAGVGDEYCNVLGYAVNQFTSGTVKELKPFQLNQSTYIPGEGFITFLLSKKSHIAGKSSKYGCLSRISVSCSLNEKLPEAEAFFLSTNGSSETGKTLKKLSFDKMPHIPVVSYSPSYGSMMTGAGFEIAAALLSLKNLRIYPAHEEKKDISEKWNILDKEKPLKQDARLCCIEAGNNDEYNLYQISS
jgi:3-oxoacyl-[acyl-carrier-protein] synthase II